MKDWMHALAGHYEDTRRRFPQEPLLILFDIDGTILDMRYLTLHVMKEFDRAHGTSHFQKLEVERLNFHENQILDFLGDLGLDDDEIEWVVRWYEKNRWGQDAVMQSHRPYRGVLEVIRWFQIQPNTFVGLNTGRPESLREETLRSLNALGREHRVDFRSDLLFMNPSSNWEGDILQAKVAGIRHFQERAYRVVAFIDNEPANLKAVADSEVAEDVLLLHADTLFESPLGHRPARSLSGREYNLTELLSEERLPPHVQLIWQGVNDEANLRQFLASNIRWGEMDIRLGAKRDRLILQDEESSDVAGFFSRLRASEKSLLIDLHEGAECLDRTIDALQVCNFPESRLGFKGELNRIEETGVRLLTVAFPGSLFQCSIDFLVPMLAAAPEQAKRFLDRMMGWGINRFGLTWAILKQGGPALEQLERWGYTRWH
ncbi:MAG TPA: HAD hydrolase-like protein [bacterium]|nr:HAD hydrolase-like protein [bacterium]